MRILTVLIFLLCFHVAAAIVNTGEDFSFTMTPATEWFGDMNATELRNASYLQNDVSQATSQNLGFGDFVKGFFYFSSTLVVGIVWVPYTMQSLGVPQLIAYYISLPVYMIYLLGIAEFIRGSGSETMR